MTTVKPETVSIYQVKKTEKDTYKKRTNWRLKDLKLIDGKDETNVREEFSERQARDSLLSDNNNL